MFLPVRKVVMPSHLARQPNGRLPASLLTTIAMPGGGTAVVLVQCAPKWNALLAAAASAGHRLSQVGDYRTFAEQEALFRDRYTTDFLAGRPTKQWLSRTWWQKPNTAVAATPGTSNHGWGLALDLCMPGGGSISDAAVDWLKAHAAEYGISAEIQSEDWHWRPYDGDAMTPAVLAYLKEGDMAGRLFLVDDSTQGVYENITTDPKTGRGVLVGCATMDYVNLVVQSGAGVLAHIGSADPKHWMVVSQWPPASGGGAVSHDELVQAAFEGAQRAERE